MAAFFNHFGRQRNIACDYKITDAKPFNYLIVSNIKARRHFHEIDIIRSGYSQSLVCYKRQLRAGTLSRSK